jgi:hypothetical protein
MKRRTHCIASLNAALTLVLCTARSVGRCHWRQTLQVLQMEAIMSNASFGAPAVDSRLCMRLKDACHQHQCKWRSDLARKLLLPVRSWRRALPKSKLDQSTRSGSGFAARSCASGSTGVTGCGKKPEASFGGIFYLMKSHQKLLAGTHVPVLELHGLTRGLQSMLLCSQLRAHVSTMPQQRECDQRSDQTCCGVGTRR